MALGMCLEVRLYWVEVKVSTNIKDGTSYGDMGSANCM